MHSEQFRYLQNSPDLEMSPEVIHGSAFAVPAIVGKGSGEGFALSNFSLPFGWEESIPKMREHGWDFQQAILDNVCESYDMENGQLEVDEDTGMLLGITIDEPLVEVNLGDSGFTHNNGEFVAHELPTYESAFAVQVILGRFLNAVNIGRDDETRYPYIDGRKGYYLPMNLEIPVDIFEKEGVISNSYFQNRFARDASNIAGRFGVSLKDLHFDDRGVLRNFSISEGNACSYYLDPSHTRDREYAAHNVDSLQQAFALQGIGAAYINEMLRK